MIPDIYLFDPDIAQAGYIKEIIIKYSLKRNVEMNIVVRNYIPEKIGETDGFGEAVSVYIIKSNKNIVKLSESIKSINPENYTVLLADNISEIIDSIRANFRPAGVILKPAEYSNIEKILDAILSDCEKNHANEFRFGFKIRSKDYLIPTNKILYFESLNKKTSLRTMSQQFEFYMSMDEIQKILPECFVRIHKSYIVNINHVISADYKDMAVCLDNGAKIFISRTYKNNIKNALNEYGRRFG